MINNIDIINSQIQECIKRGVEFIETPFYLMLGMSKTFSNVASPINGLRHPPDGITTGWYIWSGEEFPAEDDAFEPVHTIHLIKSFPTIIKFLGLPPGWRFLVADLYEDVWTDENLLDVEATTKSNLFEYFIKNKNSLLGISQKP